MTNQARIWLVVPPSVGLPLFLGSVTVIALLVHATIVTHTTWFPAYWQGGKTVKAEIAPAPNAAQVSWVVTDTAK
jgi:light-harvesting protein B-800-850 alpha chain